MGPLIDFLGNLYRFLGGINLDELVDKIVDLFDQPSYDIEAPEIKLNPIEIKDQYVKTDDYYLSDEYDSEFVFTEGGLLYDVYYFLTTHKQINQWVQIGEFEIPYSFKIKLANGIEGTIKPHTDKTTIILEIKKIGSFTVRNKIDLLRNLSELKNIDL